MRDGGYGMFLFSRLLAIAFFALPCVDACADLQKWSKQTWDDLYNAPLLLPALCGTAVSEYQVSGSASCPHSNWAAWEAKGTHKGHPTIKNNDRSGDACHFWHTWPEDINLITDLGCNAFRFSIEWSVIEPEEGVFCMEAVQHYIDMVNALLARGIEPMITLHHFTHPQWFEEKGGFASEDNIKFFVRFCEYVFNHLSDRVTLWCTINEIGPFVFEGYIEGVFPPGKTMALREAALVMRTMLKAHCEVYRALKKLPNGKTAQIGLVHQYAPFESHTAVPKTAFKIFVGCGLVAGACVALKKMFFNTTDMLEMPDFLPCLPTTVSFTKSDMFGTYPLTKYVHYDVHNYFGVGTAYALSGVGALLSGARSLYMFNAMEKMPAMFMDYIFNGAMLHFLKTGTIFPYIPFLRMTIEDAPQLYDFIGLNCYSRMVMRSRVQDAVSGLPAPDPEFPIVHPSGKDGELMTDMPYAICPEALYEGIVEIAKLGKPIFITECGAPDRSDVYRGFYIKSYLYALSRAMREGYDIRGFFYWSLMDNFEWNRGYEQKFGLYHVDFKTQKRSLYLGSQVYKELLKQAA
jgi:beta-glucosidase/6-phospho-beta-glucosidase/beta-galactosidase